MERRQPTRFKIEVVRGDVNQNGGVGLADAVIALQAAAGLSPDEPIQLEADVNDDQRLGIEEAVYALQKISVLR